MGEVLAVVGGGRMGEALVSGLLRRPVGGTTGAGRDSIRIVEADPGRRSELERRYAGVAVSATLDDPLDGAVMAAVIAVKPADVEGVCRSLAGRADRVLSIAAGVTIGSLEGWLGRRVAVVRAMPNTPALVGAGVSAISGGTNAGPADLAWARGILEAVGKVVELPEDLLDAVTGLSGSGPAYVFLFAEALVEGGVRAGLSEEVARELTAQTLLGAARMLTETGEEAAELRRAVTSPGGTTEAALRVLEARGFTNAVADAVVAATNRSRELGRR